MAASEASLSEVDREPVEVDELVREVFSELLAKMNDSPTPELKVGDLPVAHAEPSLLRSLLTNLLGNAIKFSRDRSRPRIRVDSMEESGEVVDLVADQGIGIDEAHRSEIFRPGVRLPSSSDVDGKGLGLAIVRRVVQRHGGRVWVEGNEDGGSTFKFTLGRNEAERDE